MKIEIRNIDIGKVIGFLEKEEFKGLKSIMRSKVTNFLSKELENVVTGEKTIREDLKDDKEKLQQELKEYFEATVTVEGGNMVKPLNVVKAHIKTLTSEECERSFKDEAAYALSVLYDAFNLGGEDDESDNHGN